MKSNLDYFKIATEHKEKLIDEDYHKIVNKIVIPQTINETNNLTISNEKVIRYIDTIQTLIFDMKYSIEDDKVKEIFLLIIDELKTPGMNYSSFCQYFNIHNINYSIFEKLNLDDKLTALKHIVIHFINDRHPIYKSHGYSNIVLQVMADNHSHKRKGNYGANKIANTLEQNGLIDLTTQANKDLNTENYYLLSDKKGKKLFNKFAELYNIKLSREGRETKKYPDALVKIGKHFFIIEQKNMKENGGGQDKQSSEIIDFIDKKPEFENLHYVTYVDGVYFNQLSKNAKAKTLQQYNDIISVLTRINNNYFVNSYSFDLLISDWIHNL